MGKKSLRLKGRTLLYQRVLFVLVALVAIVHVLPSVVLVAGSPTAASTTKEEDGTCAAAAAAQTSSATALAQYERLSKELQQAWLTSKNTNSTIMLSLSRDSSQIRDQSYKQKANNNAKDNDNDNKNNTTTTTTSTRLDVSHLNQIVGVNEETGGIRAQAKVTMEQLVRVSMERYHIIPAVVPEFKSITVAGAIVGGALESSSFLYGQFSDTVLECQVLLSNGTLITVSPNNEYSDLFYALPGSYGSLGIVLEATLQTVSLLPARVAAISPSTPSLSPPPKVVLSATVYDSLSDGIAVMTKMSLEQHKDEHDFIDALYFPTKGNKLSVITGKLVKEGAEETQLGIPHIRMNKGGLWFSEHMEDRLDTTSGMSGITNSSFTMSVEDYLFRYDYGAFWMARPVQFAWKTLWNEPKLAGPFFMASRYTRWLFGSLYTTANLYRALHQLDSTVVAERFVIIDAYLPHEAAADYLIYLQQTIPTSIPIWLCPVKPPPRTVSQPLSPSGRKSLTTTTTSTESENDKNEILNAGMLINVAVWGRVGDNRGIEYVAALENKMLALGGRKMLYSQTNMTAEDLYEQHVDGKAYQSLRQRYDPGSLFPALHEKLQLPSSRGTPHTKNPPRRSLKYWLSWLLL